MTITLKTLEVVMDNLVRPANDKRRIRALMPRYLRAARHGETDEVVFAHDPAELQRLVNRAGGPTHFSQASPRASYGAELVCKARFFDISMTPDLGVNLTGADPGTFIYQVVHENMPWPSYRVDPPLTCDLLRLIYTHDQQVVMAELEAQATGKWPEDMPPLVQLYDAGVYAYIYSRPLTICLLRPKIYLLNGRLHRPDGPALEWPSRRNHTFAWRGLVIPGHFVRQRDKIPGTEILQINNMEIRRAVLELVGPDKIMGRAQHIRDDSYGRLYNVRVGQETLRFVKVLNGTPNPDGSKKEYWLRVPMSIATPHQGVAWSYGMTTETYHPNVRT